MNRLVCLRQLVWISGPRLALAGVLLLSIPFARAQGPITPPGAPGATMKRLDEVEPRTNLNAANTPGDSTSVFVITQPGSYYLTGNVAVTGAGGVVNGIKIFSDNVTLDLNGFTISSTNAAAAGSGVLLGGSAAGTVNANVTILNGTIKGTTTYTTFNNTYTPGGFANGVALTGLGVTNGRVSGLNVQGVGGAGISFNGGTVEKSNVSTAGGTGINATIVTDSSAFTTAGTAISATTGTNLTGNTTGTGQDVVISGSGQPGGDRRTALAQSGPSTLNIASSGSYYLTGNVMVTSGVAINILASNVTLDLNGFTISSSASSPTGTAILLTNAGGAPKNVTISNGQIASGGTVSGTTFSPGTGFAKGIDATIGLNVRVQNVAVQGVSGNAIDLGTDRASVVTGCTVRAVGGQGIRAGVVSDSSAVGCGGPFAIDASSASNSIGTLVSGSLNAVNTSTLGQRIPILTAPYTISQPGSYYLSGNLSVATGNAIMITADNVTLDLNGFNITSTSSTANGDAVNIDGRSGIIITNGTILSGSTVAGSPATFTAGPGFVGGINYATVPRNVRVSGVTVIGVSQYGIDLSTDGSSVVQGCIVRVAGTYGIHAGSISDSSALQCGTASAPLSALTLSNCTGSNVGGAAVAYNTIASSASVAGVQTSVNTANTSLAGVQTSVATANTGISTLQQTLGSRTAIPGGTSTVTISAAGSYYLSGNITVSQGDGINIQPGNVTLDMNGFAVSSTNPQARGSGVIINGSNVRLLNGRIFGTTTNNGAMGPGFSGGGFFKGVEAGGDSIIVEAIQVIGVGSGITLSGSACTVRNCTVNTVSSFGISAFYGTVIGCSAEICGGDGITCEVAESCTGSTVSDSTFGSGIKAINALNCRGTTYNNALAGISATNATNCFGLASSTSSTGSGLKAANATNCSGQTNGASASTRGLIATQTASFCFGTGGGGSSVALQALIAIGCTYNGSATLGIRYLMP